MRLNLEKDGKISEIDIYSAKVDGGTILLNGNSMVFIPEQKIVDLKGCDPWNLLEKPFEDKNSETIKEQISEEFLRILKDSAIIAKEKETLDIEKCWASFSKKIMLYDDNINYSFCRLMFIDALKGK